MCYEEWDINRANTYAWGTPAQGWFLDHDSSFSFLPCVIRVNKNEWSYLLAVRLSEPKYSTTICSLQGVPQPSKTVDKSHTFQYSTLIWWILLPPSCCLWLNSQKTNSCDLKKKQKTTHIQIGNKQPSGTMSLYLHWFYAQTKRTRKLNVWLNHTQMPLFEYQNVSTLSGVHVMTSFMTSGRKEFWVERESHFTK